MTRAPDKTAPANRRGFIKLCGAAIAAISARPHQLARANADPGRYLTFLAEEWTSTFEEYSAEHPYGFYGHRNLILGVAIRPLTELLPGFADLVFGLDADGFSLMVSSVGIGAMSGAIWMLRQGNRGGITAIALRAGLLGGAAALVFSLTSWLPLAMVCLAVLGFSMTSGGVSTQQLVQLSVPDEMRGRVLSLFGMVFRAGPAAGALIMGKIADATGLAWPVSIGAALGLVVYIIANSRRGRLQAALEDAGRDADVIAAGAARTGNPSAERAAE